MGDLANDRTMSGSLIELYVFAEERIIEKLRKQTFDALFFLMDMDETRLPAPNVVKYAFRSLHHQPPLRRYLVDAYIQFHECDEDGTTYYECDGPENWPQEFLLAIARRFTHVLGGLRWDNKELADFDIDICNYHDHKSEDERRMCLEERQYYQLVSLKLVPFRLDSVHAEQGSQ
jgi:hypothetical protein